MRIEARLIELGIELPSVSGPIGNYVDAVRTGNLLYLAGKAPVLADGSMARGTVGAEVTVDEAYQHARLAALRLIAVVKAELGDLDRVSRVVKVLGLVNAVPGFVDHPKVINGCSDLFVQIFGEKGRHARSAVGAASLPGNITVEIECIVEVT